MVLVALMWGLGPRPGSKPESCASWVESQILGATQQSRWPFFKTSAFGFVCAVLSHFSRVWLSPGSSVHGILQQEYWSGLPSPPPGDLPAPGIEPETHCVTCIGRRVLHHWYHLGSPLFTFSWLLFRINVFVFVHKWAWPVILLLNNSPLSFNLIKMTLETLEKS